MKKTLGICVLLICTAMLVVGCKKKEEKIEYKQVSMEESKEMMGPNVPYTIMDVRLPQEYYEGHIPGAITVPLSDIGDEEIEELPSKDWLTFVYGEDEKQSKEAAEKLTKLGYTNIVEIGGIGDWDGEFQKN